MAAERINDRAPGQTHQPDDDERPFRELIPLTAPRVHVHLPRDQKAKKVQLLVNGQPVRVEESAGYVAVTVPTILAHEVIAIDLASK